MNHDVSDALLQIGGSGAACGSGVAEAMDFVRKLNEKTGGEVICFPPHLLLWLSSDSGFCLNIHLMSAAVIAYWNLKPSRNPECDRSTVAEGDDPAFNPTGVWICISLSLIKQLRHGKTCDFITNNWAQRPSGGSSAVLRNRINTHFLTEVSNDSPAVQSIQFNSLKQAMFGNWSENIHPLPVKTASCQVMFTNLIAKQIDFLRWR